MWWCWNLDHARSFLCLFVEDIHNVILLRGRDDNGVLSLVFRKSNEYNVTVYCWCRDDGRWMIWFGLRRSIVYVDSMVDSRSDAPTVNMSYLPFVATS